MFTVYKVVIITIKFLVHVFVGARTNSEIGHKKKAIIVTQSFFLLMKSTSTVEIAILDDNQHNTLAMDSSKSIDFDPQHAPEGESVIIPSGTHWVWFDSPPWGRYHHVTLKSSPSNLTNFWFQWCNYSIGFQ